MTDEPQMPPHDLDMERAILGACLVSTTASDFATARLEPGHFYARAHQKIFGAIGVLASQHEAVDLLTVGAQLAQAGDLETIGGRASLAEIVVEVASAANIRSHVEGVERHARSRALAQLSHWALDVAYAKTLSVDDFYEVYTQRLHAIGMGRYVLLLTSSRDMMLGAIQALARKREQGGCAGITTGFRDVDRLIGGYQAGDLVIVAARPSMGKTSFILQNALAAARAGTAVGIVSLETSTQHVSFRLMAADAQVDVHALMTGHCTQADFHRIATAASAIGALPLVVHDGSSVTLPQLRHVVRDMQRHAAIDVVFVDYLQMLISPTRRARESRQQEVGEISQALKALARELGIVVVAVSQLSRACEARDDKRPQLSDLRDSGSLEQDADLVLCLYRDEVYHEQDEGNENLAEVIVRKHRNGPIGSVLMQFTKQYARFADLARDENQEESVRYE